MFPVAAVIGVGVVAVIGAVAHEDHSDYSDYSYSEYSDAAERREREREAREKERRRNLKLARNDMRETLALVKKAMADAAGPDAQDIFDRFNLEESNFSYKDFNREYAKLDSEAQQKIAEAASTIFGQSEKHFQAELDDLNKILSRIKENKLTEE